MSGTSNFSHDALVGAGLSNMFIHQMKLQGWLPINEYFKMRSEGIELDWVLVLTMEKDNGFIAIPMVAEYCIPVKDSRLKPGWYKDELDHTKRIDDWTNVIMFKLIEGKNNADDIRNNMLNDFEERENIKNVPEYEESFNNMVIKLCKEDSEHYINRMLKRVN